MVDIGSNIPFLVFASKFTKVTTIDIRQHNIPIDNLETNAIILLFTGGLGYTLGLIFYAWNSLPYHHAIWHIFVMIGSFTHFFAILFFAILLLGFIVIRYVF